LIKTNLIFEKLNPPISTFVLISALRNFQNGVAKIATFSLFVQIKFKQFFTYPNRWTSLSERVAKLLSFLTYSKTVSKII